MSWLRLDDRFAAHPKVLSLTDREFRVHIKTLLYCAEYATEGVIPESARRALGATPRITKRLVDLGLWENGNQALQIHDFAVYNPKDATSAERKRRYRERKRNVEGTEEERDGNDDVPF